MGDFDFDDFSFDDSSDCGWGTDSNSSSSSSDFDSALDGFDNSSDSNDYSFDTSDFGTNDSDSNFGGDSFDNSDADDSKAKLKKTAIIMVAVGLGLLVITFLIGSLVNKSKNKSDVPDTSVVTVVDNNVYNEVQSNQQSNNVTNIITDGNPVSSSSTTVNSTTKNTNSWTEIDSSQQIRFNSEYTSLTFTITGIKHLAHVTDNNLHVKTVLTGSISGLSGTYEVEVPYNKGIMLNVGNEFAVNVLLGDYNQKTVVGDIKY